MRARFPLSKIVHKSICILEDEFSNEVVVTELVDSIVSIAELLSGEVVSIKSVEEVTSCAVLLGKILTGID